MFKGVSDRHQNKRNQGSEGHWLNHENLYMFIETDGESLENIRKSMHVHYESPKIIQIHNGNYHMLWTCIENLRKNNDILRHNSENIRKLTEKYMFPWKCAENIGKTYHFSLSTLATGTQVLYATYSACPLRALHTMNTITGMLYYRVGILQYYS